MSDNEIYLLIKYIKSVLWRAAKRLSYIEDARRLKVKSFNHTGFVSRRNSSPHSCAVCLTTLHSLFQSAFSADCYLLLPLSTASVLSIHQGHPTAAYFFLVFPSLIVLSFLQQHVLEGSSYARCGQSIYPSFFLLYVGYSSPRLYAVLPFSHDRSNSLLRPSPAPHFRIPCNVLKCFFTH